MGFLGWCWRDLRDELRTLDSGKLMVVPIAFLLALVAAGEFFAIFA